MRKLVKCVTIASLAAASPALAKEPCPPHQAGAPYPWSSNEVMTGDKWADVSLDLDTKGKATACRILKSNMSSEDNFWVCGAMQIQGQYNPVMKDGVAVAGTIQTKMVMDGMRHRDADMSARKRWFSEHPNERWDCYPE
jgi:hypothetical protein